MRRPASLALAFLVGASVPLGAQAKPKTAPTPASVRFVLDSASSEARYLVRELLAANTIENEVTGRTTAVRGSITLDPQSKVVPNESKVVIDLTTLKTDKSRRDGYVQRRTLETAQFPNAVLVVKEIKGTSLHAPPRRRPHPHARRRPDAPRRHPPDHVGGQRQRDRRRAFPGRRARSSSSPTSTSTSPASPWWPASMTRSHCSSTSPSSGRTRRVRNARRAQARPPSPTTRSRDRSVTECTSRCASARDSAARRPRSAPREDREVRGPRTDRFVILLRHHPGDLRDVAEIVHDPRREELAQRHHPELRDAPLQAPARCSVSCISRSAATFAARNSANSPSTSASDLPALSRACANRS